VDELSCNEVTLVGRVSAPPEERALPSGDLLLIWRLVVERPPPRRALPEGVRPVTTDTFDCVAWSGAVRRSARGFAAGDVVRVEGSLRRRFWRAGAGPASKCEVEVAAARRLTRPARAPQASR
jgi:single-strand DNA-binding protein